MDTTDYDLVTIMNQISQCCDCKLNDKCEIDVNLHKLLLNIKNKYQNNKSILTCVGSLIRLLFDENQKIKLDKKLVILMLQIFLNVCFIQSQKKNYDIIMENLNSEELVLILKLSKNIVKFDYHIDWYFFELSSVMFDSNYKDPFNLLKDIKEKIGNKEFVLEKKKLSDKEYLKQLLKLIEDNIKIKEKEKIIPENIEKKENIGKKENYEIKEKKEKENIIPENIEKKENYEIKEKKEKEEKEQLIPENMEKKENIGKKENYEIKEKKEKENIIPENIEKKENYEIKSIETNKKKDNVKEKKEKEKEKEKDILYEKENEEDLIITQNISSLVTFQQYCKKQLEKFNNKIEKNNVIFEILTHYKFSKDMTKYANDNNFKNSYFDLVLNYLEKMLSINNISYDFKNQYGISIINNNGCIYSNITNEIKMNNITNFNNIEVIDFNNIKRESKSSSQSNESNKNIKIGGYTFEFNCIFFFNYIFKDLLSLPSIIFFLKTDLEMHYDTILKINDETLKINLNNSVYEIDGVFFNINDIYLFPNQDEKEKFIRINKNITKINPEKNEIEAKCYYSYPKYIIDVKDNKYIEKKDNNNFYIKPHSLIFTEIKSTFPFNPNKGNKNSFFYRFFKMILYIRNFLEINKNEDLVKYENIQIFFLYDNNLIDEKDINRFLEESIKILINNEYIYFKCEVQILFLMSSVSVFNIFSLNSKLKNIESAQNDLKKDYNYLKENNDSLKQSNDLLKQSYDSLKQNYDSLKEKFDSLKHIEKDYSNLIKRIESLEKEKNK